ncbi:MAG: 2'-5' RNA ligase family protein [Flavisolibacter sp.]|jgi:2'-5' RNA ligase
MEVPFSLTVAIEENAFLFLNALRKIYFPTGQNHVEAHLTLFHLLPNEASVIDAVNAASRQYKTLPLQIKKPVLTDDGVVYTIECDALKQLHEDLQQQWSTFLIPQDKQKLQPHITLQKNVAPEAAKELLQFLNENFCAFEAKGTGLKLWEYYGGSWKLFKQFPFTES